MYAILSSDRTAFRVTGHNSLILIKNERVAVVTSSRIPAPQLFRVIIDFERAPPRRMHGDPGAIISFCRPWMNWKRFCAARSPVWLYFSRRPTKCRQLLMNVLCQQTSKQRDIVDLVPTRPSHPLFVAWLAKNLVPIQRATRKIYQTFLTSDGQVRLKLVKFNSTHILHESRIVAIFRPCRCLDRRKIRKKRLSWTSRTGTTSAKFWERKWYRLLHLPSSKFVQKGWMIPCFEFAWFFYSKNDVYWSNAVTVVIQHFCEKLFPENLAGLLIWATTC